MANKPEDDQSMICGIRVAGARSTVKGVRLTGFHTPIVVEGENHSISGIKAFRHGPKPDEKRPTKYFSGWTPPRPFPDSESDKG